MQKITRTAIIFIAIQAINTLASTVFAHDGHAQSGFHWHATDVWGFVVLAALVAAAVWLSDQDK
jgi:hypothetical protein